MSLVIQPAAHIADDLTLAMKQRIRTIVLDVDDTIYHAGTNLHGAIKAKICEDANSNRELRDMRSGWAREKKIDGDGMIKPKDLGWAFPLIVNHYRQDGYRPLMGYLQRVYDVDYSVVPAQPEFVRAVDKLRDNGVRVVLYTNGPFGYFDGQPLHVNKTLERIGFGEMTFQEKDVVDLAKTDRMPSLLDQYGFSHQEAAEVFRKPEPAAFARMAETLGFKPGPDVAYHDDVAKNLDAATRWGVMRVQGPTSADQLKDKDAQGKRDYAVWSDARNDRGQLLSIGGQILTELAALYPEPRKSFTARSSHFFDFGRGSSAKAGPDFV